MTRTFQLFAKASPITKLLLTSCTSALLVISAQAQQSTSLADAARQARAQKQAQPQANGQAQQYANELSEDQADNGAPGGFKTYNTGDYKIWVPAPYHLDGHDDAGVVLSGPPVGGKHVIVLLGNPVVAKFESNDAAFQDAAMQFSHLYAQSATCSKATVASHTAYQCGLAAGTLLGERITGNAVFVSSLGKLYPVFCLAPSDSRSRDFMNEAPNAAIKSWGVKGAQKDDEDVKNVLQKCATVFQSIRISEGISAQKSADASGPTGKPAQPATGSPAAASAGGTNTLADAVRGLKQGEPAQSAPTSSTSADMSPAASDGPKVQAFIYCKTASQCWNASVLVPANAQLVSSDCKQYIFEVKVQGSPFVLMAGMGGADSCAGHGKGDTSQVHFGELAAPDSTRIPGSYTLLGSQGASLDGKPAIITQILFRRGTTNWTGKRAEIDANGVPLVVGCMAPKEHFADGDAICSALIDSLRLP